MLRHVDVLLFLLFLYLAFFFILDGNSLRLSIRMFLIVTYVSGIVDVILDSSAWGRQTAAVQSGGAR